MVYFLCSSALFSLNRMWLLEFKQFLTICHSILPLEENTPDNGRSSWWWSNFVQDILIFKKYSITISPFKKLTIRTVGTYFHTFSTLHTLTLKQKIFSKLSDIATTKLYLILESIKDRICVGSTNRVTICITIAENNVAKIYSPPLPAEESPQH